MKKRNIVLSILLSVAIVASSLAPAFAAENPEPAAEITSVIGSADSNAVSNFVSGRLTEKSDESPENIVAKYYNKDSVLSAKSKSTLFSQATEDIQLNTDKQFKIVKQFKNSTGRTVVQTVQTYKGVPIYGSGKNFHINSDGVIECITGANVENIESKVVAASNQASEEEALKAVENDLGFKPEYVEAPQYELVLFPVNDTYVYAYKVSVNYTKPAFGDFIYYIDANNLSVLRILTNTASVEEPVIGSGIGQSGTLIQNLKMVKDDTNTYYLENTEENVSTISSLTFKRFSEPDSCFDSGTATNFQQDAVDAQNNTSKVVKFFKDTFNRNGNDDLGSPYNVYIDEAATSFNAYGGINTVRFNVGHAAENGRSVSCALDAVAHEYTHGILLSEGLTIPVLYDKQCSELLSLHEGLSDVFGTLCEYYTSINEGTYDQTFDWTLAEDSGAVLRDCANPVIDDYSDYLTVTATNPSPHLGGGVISKAASLIAMGGTHNGVTVTPIGYDKLANIFYKAINDGYFPLDTYNMTFRLFAEAAVQVASQVYGISSPEIQTVKDAFAATGVFTPLLKSFYIYNRSGLAIVFGWDSNGVSADTYAIYRKKTGSPAEPEQVKVTAGTTAGAETFIGSYDFCFAKVDSSGNKISDYSNVITMECYSNAPENFTMSNRSGLIVEFSWTGLSDATYAIYRKATGSSDAYEKVKTTTDSTATADTLMGSYDFCVAQVDSDGYRLSNYSTPITVEAYYNAPENFTMANRSGLKVGFSWTGSPDATYAIYRKATGSSDAYEKVKTTTNSTATADTLMGSYDFCVAQVDSNGNRISNFSTPITVEAYYSAPENLTISNRSGLQIQFSWTGSSDATYAIYRKATGSSDIPEKINITTGSTVTVDTLVGSYDFYVAQVDSNGNRISYYSTPVTVES
jgi:Zn-dependent metalloprotease